MDSAAGRLTSLVPHSFLLVQHSFNLRFFLPSVGSVNLLRMDRKEHLRVLAAYLPSDNRHVNDI